VSRHIVLFLMLALALAWCGRDGMRLRAAEPPVISESLRARFWKNQAWLIQAKSNLDDAQREATAIGQELRAACGGKDWAMDAKNEPACKAE
jgi:hypothetical protein